MGFAWFGFVTDCHAESGCKSQREAIERMGFVIVHAADAAWSSELLLANRRLVELFWRSDSIEGTVDQLSSQVCVSSRSGGRGCIITIYCADRWHVKDAGESW